MRSRGEEGLRDENGGRAAVRGRAALELGERVVDGGGFEDVVERVDLLELGVGVLGGVGVVDAGDLSKVPRFGAVS